MKRRWLALIAFVIIVVAILWHRYGRADEIEYRGQKIKLSKTYEDFDDYKNDPDNIHPSETVRVQKLVMEAPIARSFSTRLEVFQATQEIVFPGYGSGSVPGTTAEGKKFFAVLIEIPRAQKERYVVFEENDGGYNLIDDFVHDDVRYPVRITVEDGAYVYYSDEKEVFRRPFHNRPAH